MLLLPLYDALTPNFWRIFARAIISPGVVRRSKSQQWNFWIWTVCSTSGGLARTRTVFRPLVISSVHGSLVIALIPSATAS